jgi:hypothetical protein
MRVRYTGYGLVRRVVGDYTWHGDAGAWVQDVAESALLAELLTSPGAEFVIADDDPLVLIGLTTDQCAALALAGVASAADLADMRPSSALADALSVSLPTLRGWCDAARNATKTSKGQSA